MRFPERMGRRFTQLTLGLVFFGLGVAAIVRADLGASPWDVLAQGLGRSIHLSFGTVTILLGAAVLVLWIPLRQRPGIGTVINVLLIGLFADVGLAIYPVPDVLWAQIALLAAGVVVVGLGSGLYIGAGLGPGPRDGLMTGLHTLTGKPIWMVRTLIEVTVLALGWLLGGTVGLGTVAVALLIGPLCELFLRIFTIREVTPAAAD